MVENYEEKQQQRKQRYEDRARKAEKQAQAHSEDSNRLASAIPMGQPILVGHHSESKHRNLLKKIDSKMRRSIEESKKAEHYKHKAESVGNGGISSDDPEAVVKLKEKLSALETQRERMKNFNKLIKKGVFVEDLPEITQSELEDLKSIARHQPYYCKETPTGLAPIFPPYALQNIGGKIRATKQRIEVLLKEHNRPEVEPVQHKGYRVEENKAENRIQVFFDEKPSKDVCKIMRFHGFRFSRRNMAWQRHLNNAGRWAVEAIEGKLKETE